MLSLSSSCRYYLYAGQADMRKSHGGLSGLVRDAMTQDPLSGDVFIFLNKKRNQVKLLHWEGDGLSIYYKKLERGTYELPALDVHTQSVHLRSDELMLILQGISLDSVKRRPRFDFNDPLPILQTNTSRSHG